MTSAKPQKRRLIVGISGASGIIYGVRLLELLRQTDIESHLVVSKAAERTRAEETQLTAADLRNRADVNYPNSDIGAAIASGSFRTLGMVIVPCSVKTLAEIAAGVSTHLLSRAADVVLKERRRLVLAVRESPLNSIHLQNMLTVTQAGAVIAPPMPAFYTRPQSIDDLVTNSAARLLDLFDIDIPQLVRWGEPRKVELDSPNPDDVDPANRLQS